MKNSKNQRIIKSGLRISSRYKLRTFFMMLGVIIGITALTLALTIGNGIEKKIKDNVSKLFNNKNVMISAQKIQVEEVRETDKGPNTSLKIDDIDAIANEVNDLVIYDYLNMLPEQEIKYKQNNTTTTIKGCSAIGEIVWNRPV